VVAARKAKQPLSRNRRKTDTAPLFLKCFTTMYVAGIDISTVQKNF